MGELREAYALAGVAIVGGGFAHHGGHNPYEPDLPGAPAIFGTHFGAFADEADNLLRATPEAQISSARDPAARISEWLQNEAKRRGTLDARPTILPDGAEIGERNASALAPWLRARFP